MDQENIDAKTRELVNALSFDAPVAENTLRDWFHMFPESLYRVTGAGLPPKAEVFVCRLLTEDEECCRHLCDPTLLDAPTATKLARSLLLVERRFDMRLAHAAIEWIEIADYQKPLRRCLEILDAMASGSRINSTLVRLLNSRNAAVRSKVVDLLVRSWTNEVKIREWLCDPDPRIRANVLESLPRKGWGTEWIQQIFLDHLDDPYGRAAANAAIGLYHIGKEEPALAKLSAMALSADPSVRCSAAWAMGQIPNAKMFEILNQLRTDSASRVRWHALRSLSCFNRAGVRPQQPAPSAEPPKNRSAAQSAPAKGKDRKGVESLSGEDRGRLDLLFPDRPRT